MTKSCLLHRLCKLRNKSMGEEWQSCAAYSTERMCSLPALLLNHCPQQYAQIRLLLSPLMLLRGLLQLVPLLLPLLPLCVVSLVNRKCKRCNIAHALRSWRLIGLHGLLCLLDAVKRALTCVCTGTQLPPSGTLRQFSQSCLHTSIPFGRALNAHRGNYKTHADC